MKGGNWGKQEKAPQLLVVLVAPKAPPLAPSWIKDKVFLRHQHQSFDPNVIRCQQQTSERALLQCSSLRSSLILLSCVTSSGFKPFLFLTSSNTASSCTSSSTTLTGILFRAHIFMMIVVMVMKWLWRPEAPLIFQLWWCWWKLMIGILLWPTWMVLIDTGDGCGGADEMNMVTLTWPSWWYWWNRVKWRTWHLNVTSLAGAHQTAC